MWWHLRLWAASSNRKTTYLRIPQSDNTGTVMHVWQCMTVPVLSCMYDNTGTVMHVWQCMTVPVLSCMYDDTDTVMHVWHYSITKNPSRKVQEQSLFTAIHSLLVYVFMLPPTMHRRHYVFWYSVSCLAMTLIFDLWPWTFQAISTHMMNIFGKFHWNPSTKFTEILLERFKVRGQRSRSWPDRML